MLGSDFEMDMSLEDMIAEATACSPNYRIAWVQIYVEIFSRLLQILQKKFRLKHNLINNI
jgi:hypothetical protein